MLGNGHKFGEHPAVRQFMRGVFHLATPTPRYSRTWDPDTVIEMLKNENWVTAKRLPLLQLSQKLVTLILLASSQRGQVIQALTLDNMKVSDTGVQFLLSNNDLKQGRPGYKPDILTFNFFHVKKVCVARYIQVYLARTQEIRGDIRKIFITSKKTP